MLILIIGLIILAGIAMTVGVLHNRQIQKKIESGELKAVQYVYDEREEYIQTLKESKLNRAIPIIMDLITKYSK